MMTKSILIFSGYYGLLKCERHSNIIRMHFFPMISICWILWCTIFLPFPSILYGICGIKIRFSFLALDPQKDNSSRRRCLGAAHLLAGTLSLTVLPLKTSIISSCSLESSLKRCFCLHSHSAASLSHRKQSVLNEALSLLQRLRILSGSSPLKCYCLVTIHKTSKRPSLFIFL